MHAIANLQYYIEVVFLCNLQRAEVTFKESIAAKILKTKFVLKVYAQKLRRQLGTRVNWAHIYFNSNLHNERNIELELELKI